MSGVAEYDVSADGRKLLYRTGGGAGGRGRGGAGGAAVNLFSRRRGSQPAASRSGAPGRVAPHVSRAARGVQADLRRGLAQPARLSVRAERARLELAEDEGDVRRAPAATSTTAPISTTCSTTWAPRSPSGTRTCAAGPCPTCRPSPGGLLGADFVIEGGRYKITRIYDNESWNPDLRAPLSAPGVEVSVGDFIVAINGIELRAPDNIYRLLDGTANRQTVLTVNSKPVDGRRAAGHRGADGDRAGAAHAGLGRAQPPARRQAVERSARLRLRAEHRPGRLRELQPLLLRAAGQEGRDRRRALQRRRIGGRLHRRRARPRLRRLLQQRRRRSLCRSPAPRPASGARR